MTKKRKRKTRNGFIFWNIVALSLLLTSIGGLYWIVGIRVQQGWWVAEQWVIVLDHVFYAMLTATLIGWGVGSLLARAKGKK